MAFGDLREKPGGRSENWIGTGGGDGGGELASHHHPDPAGTAPAQYPKMSPEAHPGRGLYGIQEISDIHRRADHDIFL